MSATAITTVQVQGISAETLLQRFDNLESQIKLLQQQPNPSTDRLITRDETAKLLGVSLVTLHNWVKSNILIAYRVGNKVRFKENEVLASLQQINSKR
ncbi:DNA-binding protein [Flavobacterium sp. SOK18b]|uniref:helix-turn-helix domain-containing protein n=1 Tax=Flavobacterium sp. SOK18b TaxID=797900 RepID=UPI0015FB72F1|nr:helix-turn-helix domain-containing protein [Flavobacterium sp. SOK18b]MBB1192599.1 DNA-binding protein [Flavobacterium sp. SOK18b]